MCGRFAISMPKEAMAELFKATPANDLPQTPNYNICPTNDIHTITSDEGTRHLKSMRWGFVPSWYVNLSGGPLLINARSETIAEKPAFRNACRSRRCIIPAMGFMNGRGNREKSLHPIVLYEQIGNQWPWRVFGRTMKSMAQS